MKKWIFLLAILGGFLAISTLNAQNYRVGDVVVNENDHSSGVVFWVHPDESYGWMVALKDLPAQFQWSDQNILIPGLWQISYPQPGKPGTNNWVAMRLAANSDTAGFNNTRLIRAVLGSSAAYAACQVDFDHGWYLPGAGQMSELFGVIDQILPAILGAGGANLLERWYWTSSQTGMQIGCQHFPGTGHVSFEDKTSKDFVRPVRTFFNGAPLSTDTTLRYRWNTGDSVPEIHVHPPHDSLYQMQLTTAQGCSKTVSKRIYVGGATLRTLFDTICCQNPYNANGFNLGADRTQTPGDTVCLTTVIDQACQVPIVLNLYRRPQVEHAFDTSFCQGRSFLWNGRAYTTPGTYQQKFASAAGCDSTVSLKLIEKPHSVFRFAQTDTGVCLWNDRYYFASGSYDQVLVSQNGCDSTATMRLTIIVPPPFSNLDTLPEHDSICPPQLPFTHRGRVFTEAGNYDLYPNDSLCVKYALYVGKTFDSIFAFDTCDALKLPFGTFVRDTLFSHAYQNQDRCDSTETYQIHIRTSDTTRIIIDSIDQATYLGDVYTNDTAFFNVYLNQELCDSVVETRLHITRSDTTTGCEIVVYWGKVLALANRNNYEFLARAVYEWSRDGQVLEGAAAYIEVGKPIPGGTYRVKATWDGGSLERQRTFATALPAATLFPNPAKVGESLHLELIDPEVVSASIYDVQGVRQRIDMRREGSGYRLDGFRVPGLYILQLERQSGEPETLKILIH